MGNQDFYVSFGSDAGDFGTRLKNDLAGARTEIALFQKELDSLGKGPAGSALARLLEGITAAKRGGASPPPAAPPAGTGGGGPDFSQMAREAASYNAELSGAMSKIATIIQGFDRLAGTVTKEERRANKSRASAESAALQSRNKGRFSNSSDPNASVAKSRVSVRDAPTTSSGGASRVSIAGTPRVAIDDAAFRHLSDRVDKGTKATRDVERAVKAASDQLVKALGERNSGGGGKREGGKKKGKREEDALNVDPQRDAAFTRVSELRAQIANRQRLTSLNQLQSQLGKGQKPSTDTVKAAAAGSGQFLLDLQNGKTGRVQKAIDALKSDLAGVPKLRALQAELGTAIAATGTEDGKRTGDYRAVAVQRRQAATAARPPKAEKQARDTSAEAIRAERNKSIALLSGGLEPLKFVRDKLVADKGDQAKIDKLTAQIIEVEQEIARLAKPLKSERRASNRAARREADKSGPPRLNQQETEDHLTNLALPGDEDMFREMVRKRDLTRKHLTNIADTFSAQGYDTPYKKNTRVPELTDSILASRQAYDASGGQLAIPLNSQGTKVSSSVRKDVRQYIARILKASKLTVEEELALETLKLDRESGGTGIATQTRSGRAKRAQFPERGAVFGGEFGEREGLDAGQSGAASTQSRRHDLEDEATRAARRAAEETRARQDPVTDAEYITRDARARATESAIRKAGELVTKHPDFNPYDPALRAGVTGTGTEAREARAALNRLTRAITAWDQRVDPAALGAGSPVRAGIEARRFSRNTFDEQRAQDEAARRDRSFTAHTIRDSATQALFGGGTVLGTGRSNRSLSRLFPGLRSNRQGVLRAVDDGPIAEPDVAPVNKAFNRYVAAFRNLAKLGEPGSGASPADIEQAQTDIAKSLTRFIGAYEKAAKTTLPAQERQITDHQGYDPSLGYGQQVTVRDYGLVQQQAALKADRAAAARARQVARAAGPDPKLLRTQADSAAALARTIGGVSYDGGTFRDRKGSPVDVHQTIASATTRQKEIEEGKRQAPEGERAPELRRQFESLTRPTIVGLQQQLERSARNAANAQARAASPDADLAGPARARLQATVEKQRAVVESSTATDKQRVAAQRSLTQAQNRLALTETALAAEERKRAQDLAEQHQQKGRQAAGQLAALDPRTRDSAHEGEVRDYLQQLAAQTARRNIAQEALDKAKEQASLYSQGKTTGENAGRPVYAPEAKRLEQNAIYEDYMLSQVKRPSPGRQATAADQLAGLQRASQAYADQTMAAYRVVRPLKGKKKAAVDSGGGGGTGGGGDSTGGSGGGEGVGGHGDVFARMLAELVAIHGVLRGGIRVSGRAAPHEDGEATAAANSGAAQAGRKSNSAAARAEFFRELPDDIATAIAAEDRLGAATALVTSKIRTQAQAVAYLRQELKLEDAAANQLADDLKRTIADASLKRGTAKAKAVNDDRQAAANRGLAQGKKKKEPPAPVEYATKEGRAAFFANLPDGIAAAIAGEDALGAATALVTGKIRTQTQAVAYLAQELKLEDAAAKKLADDLKRSVADASLKQGTDSSQARDARAAAQAAIERGKAQKQAAKDGEQAAVAARSTTRAEADFADTMGRVSSRARTEVTALRDLVRTGADNAAIVHQQAIAYRALNAELEAKGFKAPERNAKISNVFASAGAPVTNSELRQVGRSSAAGSRSNARAEADFADTMGRVSSRARAEVTALRELIRTGADNAAVVRQQAVAYRTLNAELEAKGFKTASARNAKIGNTFAAVGAPTTGRELSQIQHASTARNTDAPEQKSVEQRIFGEKGFMGRVANSASTFVVRNASAGVVFGVTNALQDAIAQGVETESTFVRVSEALDKTGRSSSGLRTQLQGLSQEYGVALKDVYTTTAGLTGLFDQSDNGNKQLVGLTRVAVQLQLISGGALNATEAMTGLSSVTSAYSDVSASHIADVATVIQNRLSVNIEETIEGVARLSGQTAVMGIGFEKAATYVASIAKFTNQTGAGAGEQFSRILASLQTGKTQKVVSSALLTQGVDVRGAFAVRDYQTAIDTLLGSYSNLSKAERDRVATAIGGQRQAAAINGLLKEGNKVLDTATAAQNSNGAASERAAAISAQLAAQMQKARAAFVSFFAVLVQTGVLDGFGVVLTVVLKALELVNTGLSKFNDIIDASPFTSTVRDWGLAIAGLAVGFTLARKAAEGLVAVMSASGAGRLLLGRGAGRMAGTTASAEAEGGVAAAGRAGGAASGAAQVGLLSLLLGRGGRRPTGADVPMSERGRMNPQLYTPRPGAATPIYNGGPGSAASSARVFSYAQRFGPVDENGVPLRRSQRFYARQSVRLTNFATRAEDRAAALRASATSRLNGGYDPALGYGPNVRTGVGTRVVAGAERAAAGGLGADAKVADRAADRTAAMARSASIANFALIGIGTAASLAVAGLQSLAETHSEFAAAFKAAYGSQKKDPTENSDAGRSRNYFQTVSQRNDARNQAIMTGIPRAFVGAFVSTFKGIGTVKYADQQSGVVSDEENQKYFFNTLQKTYGRFHKFNLGKKSTFNLEGVQAAIAANQKDIEADAKAINKSGMTDAQKSALLASLGELASNLQRSGDMFRLAAMGINKLDNLTMDQLEGIGSMVTTLTGFSTSISKNFAPLLRAYVGSLGFQEGSSYQKDLNELAAGGPIVTTPFTPTQQAEQVRMRKLNQANSSGEGGAPSYAATPLATGRDSVTHPLSQDGKSLLGIKILREALKTTQAKITGPGALPEGEDRTAAIQAAVALEGTIDGMMQTRAQRLATDAAALISRNRQTGNFSAAAAGAARSIAALQREKYENHLTAAQVQDQAGQIQDQAAQDRASAASKQYEDAKLYTRAPIESARLELASANAALAALKQGGANYATLHAASQRAQQAAYAMADAQSSLALQTLTTNLLRKRAPGDAVGQAQDALRVALATQRDAAARFTTNSDQYQTATQGVIQAQRTVDAALIDVTDANANLAIVYATSAGNTVLAARRTLEQAQKKLADAKGRSGGRRTSEVINAEAAESTAKAGVRDAIFNDSMGTIDFNQQMGKLTTAGAIAQYQNILRTQKLTRDERRQVLLKIHGMQQDLVSSLTSSGFNIPGDIKLPTPYEVRRSLGVDRLQKSMKDAVTADGGFSLSAQKQVEATTKLPGSSSTAHDLVGAMKAVQTAVQANGATKVSFHQENKINAPTAAVANAIVRQVIHLLNQQTAQQSRASTSTPRTVPTR